MRIHARHYATGAAIELVLTAGRIERITPPHREPPDLRAGWVAPGFFDLQINGCDGHSFNSGRLTTDSIRHVVDVCRKHGITGLCPTLITNSFTELARLYDVTVLGVSNVGPVTGGPWTGRKAIGCSLAVGPGGAILAQGPYGERAEEVICVEVQPRPAAARGTDIAAALARKGYCGP